MVVLIGFETRTYRATLAKCFGVATGPLYLHEATDRKAARRKAVVNRDCWRGDCLRIAVRRLRRRGWSCAPTCSADDTGEYCTRARKGLAVHMLEEILETVRSDFREGVAVPMRLPGRRAMIAAKLYPELSDAKSVCPRDAVPINRRVMSRTRAPSPLLSSDLNSNAYVMAPTPRPSAESAAEIGEPANTPHCASPQERSAGAATYSNLEQIEGVEGITDAARCCARFAWSQEEAAARLSRSTSNEACKA